MGTGVKRFRDTKSNGLSAESFIRDVSSVNNGGGAKGNPLLNSIQVGLNLNAFDAINFQASETINV